MVNGCWDIAEAQEKAVEFRLNYGPFMMIFLLWNKGLRRIVIECDSSEALIQYPMSLPCVFASEWWSFTARKSPLEIAGVNHIDFWHMVRNARREKLGEPELGPLEFYAYIYPKLDLVNMKTDFLNRNGNSYVHFLYFANKKNANIDYFILRVQPHLKLLVVEGEETL
ncbi:hypothetical protein PVK06_036229 [Gossypium arboreum]|uniref:Uncharacterized protein n=1 Tax=Gossypium arboreum TaxID=29729 RepID=A0ABR0NIY3_GOSAR|nr:hypothetical protein PVK06_036229 [Gossypium arboreum]